MSSGLHIATRSGDGLPPLQESAPVSSLNVFVWGIQLPNTEKGLNLIAKTIDVAYQAIALTMDLLKERGVSVPSLPEWAGRVYNTAKHQQNILKVTTFPSVVYKGCTDLNVLRLAIWTGLVKSKWGDLDIGKVRNALKMVTDALNRIKALFPLCAYYGIKLNERNEKRVNFAADLTLFVTAGWSLSEEVQKITEWGCERWNNQDSTLTGEKLQEVVLKLVLNASLVTLAAFNVLKATRGLQVRKTWIVSALVGMIVASIPLNYKDSNKTYQDSLRSKKAGGDAPATPTRIMSTRHLLPDASTASTPAAVGSGFFGGAGGGQG